LIICSGECGGWCDAVNTKTLKKRNVMREKIARLRSIRRFKEEKKLSREFLTGLIELARLSGSSRNCQPWQYQIVDTPELCAELFPHLAWAGYLPQWKGPEPGQRPSAYIFCLLNSTWQKGPDTEAYFDLGSATQNIIIGAMEEGVGVCRIGSFGPGAAGLFKMPEHLSLRLVLALGEVDEEVVLETARDEEDIRYWHDEAGVHHVPKRALKDVIVDLERQ
jgi:nitroreductase